METWRHELYHHGIMGMKWGVRRYQNKDGTLTAEGKKRILEYRGNVYNNKEDFSLKKGQRLDRVSDSDEKNEGSTFVSFTDNDRVTYQAYMYLERRGKGAAQDALKKYEMTPVKDLKVAGAKTQMQVLSDILGETSMVDDQMRYYKNADSNTQKQIRKKISDYYGKSVSKNLDEYVGIVASRLVDRDSYVNQQLTKKLQEKGYDACVDLWDASKIAETPVYIFDRSNTKVTKTSQLTREEYADAYNKVVMTPHKIKD